MIGVVFSDPIVEINQLLMIFTVNMLYTSYELKYKTIF